MAVLSGGAYPFAVQDRRSTGSIAYFQPAMGQCAGEPCPDAEGTILFRSDHFTFLLFVSGAFLPAYGPVHREMPVSYPHGFDIRLHPADQGRESAEAFAAGVWYRTFLHHFFHVCDPADQHTGI